MVSEASSRCKVEAKRRLFRLADLSDARSKPGLGETATPAHFNLLHMADLGEESFS